MPNYGANRIITSRARLQTAVLTGGLCVSLAVGGGVAAAAEAGAPQDPFAASTASSLAEATERQADSQHKAAEAKKAAAEKAEKAEKKAEQKAKKKARSWVRPVDKPYKLTADFGNSGNRWSSKHSGQDFAVATGTKVESVHKGTVVTTGWGGSYGNRVVIDHGNGKYSQYAHLSKIGVQPGDQVNTGEKIASSGNTGNTSGPHLHFEIRNTPAYGSGIDPVPFLDDHGLKL